MTDLDRLRVWLRKCPNADAFQNWKIDYTDQLPGTFGVFPAGLVENSRREDILGNITVENQYNFSIYLIFPKAPGDDTAAQFNADWVMEFQHWVQEQSARHFAPTFGDDPLHERIRAQNGALYTAEASGLAMYMIQISATFSKNYKS